MVGQRLKTSLATRLLTTPSSESLLGSRRGHDLVSGPLLWLDSRLLPEPRLLP